MQFIKRSRHQSRHFTGLSIVVDDKMAAILFFSKYKSSSGERESLTPCNNEKNIARLFQRKVNGDLFTYTISKHVFMLSHCVVACLFPFGFEGGIWDFSNS